MEFGRVQFASGVNVTEQEFVPEIGRVQVPPEENVPALELVKVTVPPEIGRASCREREKVAVQVDAEITGTLEGEQATEVPEVRLVPVTVSVPAVLLWSVSHE